MPQAPRANQAQAGLRRNVLDSGSCTGCSACVGLCPYQDFHRDETVVLHARDRDFGRCYRYCPRTPTDFEAVRESLFAASEWIPGVGACRGLYLTRATAPEPCRSAQHGGTVSALMALALDEGIIDTAVLTGRDAQMAPEAVAVREGEAALGIIPVENSSTGSVHDNYDLLLEYDVRIVGEVTLRIEHNLIGQPGTPLADLRRIYLNDIVTSYLKTPEFGNLSISHSKTSLGTELADDLLNVKGSALHLSKVIMNLVGNAAEAMPAGGTIRICTRNRYLDTATERFERIPEGEYVLLRITDEGVGIPAEELPRIFEPFYSKKKMGRSGSGLGMTVVWNTIKDHGGFVDIQSQEGVGTRFDVFLPATREENDRTQHRVVLQDYTGTERLLVVDDIQEQRDIAVRMLGKLGYQVAPAAGGEEAVAYLQAHTVDLVVLDMVMPPGFDGLETYRRILDFHPGQKAIIVSGYSPSERVKAMQHLGAGEYIRKPYTLEKIGLAVRRELDRKPA